MRLRHGSASHVGLVRRQNEDSFVARDGLYAVCDGMGGAQAGEVASETACRIVLSVDPGKDARQELSRAVRESNRDIREQSYRDAAMQGMGTTLTAAAVREETLTIAHVGDSRAYRLRDGRLEQLTQDHSLVAEMVRLGRLTPAQAASHPHRSIITRALGPEEVVQPDVFDVPLHVDDRLLFCSDGLSGMVSDREISGILGRGHDPQAMADALIRAALAGGGEDNVTAVVVVVLSDGDPEQPETATDGRGVLVEAEAAPGAASLSPEQPVPATPDLDPDGPSVAQDAPAAGEEAGRRPPRWGRRRVLLALAGLLVIAAVGVGGFALWNSTVYFVGTREGKVALYRGMPYRVVGVTLYETVEVSPTRYDTLDDYLKARIDTHELVTKEEGQRFIRGLASGE